MITVALAHEDDFDGWRSNARNLIAAGVPADQVHWSVEGKRDDLFAGAGQVLPRSAPLAVPRAFVGLAQSVICHTDPQRFALLYQLLVDLRSQRRKMDDAADPLLRKLEMHAKAVRRDIHKMRAFLRFRELCTDAGEAFVAYYEPEHHIIRHNAKFFVDRFANMRWSILAPELSLHWDGKILREGPPARREDLPPDDGVEEQWHAYYRSIFNPARLKVGAMLKEMPRKYWHNMPETAHIPDMIKTARARTVAMLETQSPAMAEIDQSWDSLRADAPRCRRCPLYANATQFVFGEGPVNARIMIVGEQPGDEEDKAGRPFVGPAGQILDAALAEAGLNRAEIFITNAVKHFKYEIRGKRRLHARPNAGEIDHCRWWLTREIGLVQPDIIIALGATAIRGLTGKTMAIKSARTQLLKSIENVPVLATIHPSYLLRLPDREMAARERSVFVEELRSAQSRVGGFH